MPLPTLIPLVGGVISTAISVVKFVLDLRKLNFFKELRKELRKIEKNPQREKGLQMTSLTSGYLRGN